MIRYPLLIAIIIIIASSVSAQEIKGEIINVNYEYEIAFTDIGNMYLSAGDNVYVVLSSGKKLPLRVMEASAVLSKITLKGSLANNDLRELFKQINVGDIVIKAERDVRLLPEETNQMAQPLEAILPSPVSTSQKRTEQLVARYNELKSDYEQVKTQLQETQEQKQQLHRGIEHVNREISKQTVYREKIESENKLLKKNLSESVLAIEKLQKEKRDQSEKIIRLGQIIKQLNDKLSKLSEFFKKNQ